MGSVPSQTIEIDLNGTGTLVDVTSYVDMDEGIRHSWGRTASDPFRSEPPPGSLTFTLDNNDGRFTPGNTATYTVGLVEGVLVQWTCGTRVRRFRTGVPDVAFPTQVGGRCTVSVACLDALALLAKREMRPMVDEVAFTVRPVAYWPLADSGDDISGNAEVELTPVGADTSLMTWSNSVGPRTDGRSAVTLQPDATTFLGDASSPALSNLSALGGTVAQSWRKSGSVTEYGYAISFWFSVRDIYGGTFSTTNDYDGPYVILAVLGQQTVLWRLADRKLILGGTYTLPQAMSDLPAVQPGTVNHVFMWVKCNTTTNGILVRFWLNGVETLTAPGSSGLGTFGSPSAPTVYVGGSNGTQAFPDAEYGLSGSAACVGVYTFDQADAMATAGVIPDIYDVGTNGPSEDAGARFQRLGPWLGRSGISYSVEGTPQSSLMDAQNTDGKSMLSAMCTALALEERVIDCATVAGVETVRAWMHERHRGVTPALTVDVQDDGTGVPTLTFDASGVAVQVSVKGFSRTVTWLDTDAPERWQGTSASLDAATDDFDALRALAQFRTILGRVTTMTPSKVSVDAASSKASLTTDLLALEPMDRIRIDGLPAGIIGFSEVDAILVGCVETHSLGRNVFDLQLTPDLPYTGGRYDTARYGGIEQAYDFTTPWSTGGHPISGTFPAVEIMDAVQTICTFRLIGSGTAPPPYTYLPTGALATPVYFRWDDEIIKVTSVAAPTIDVFNYGTANNVYEANWVFTVVRGQMGTTAAAHSLQSGGGILHSWPPGTMGVDPYTTHTDPVVTFLDMQEQYGF